MPANLPAVHIGNNEIVDLHEKCYPTIEAREGPDTRMWAWAQLSAVFGVTMERYFDWPPDRRIPQAQYETGEVFAGWYGVQNPYPKPSFSSAHPNPLIGILGVGANGFMDAAGLVNPIGVHAGDLFLCMTEGVDVDPVLDLFAECGYQWTRSWITLMWYKQGWPGHFWGLRGCSPNVTQNYWHEVGRWIEKHIARKLKVHLSMGDMNNVPMAELERFYDKLGDVISFYGPEHFIAPGEINESRDIWRDGTPEKAWGLISRIRNRFPQILYTTSAFTGYYGNDYDPPYHEVVRQWTAPWQKIYQKHGDRTGNNTTLIRHTFNDGYEFYRDIRTWGYDSEHFGPGRHVYAPENNKGNLRAGTMGLIAIAAVLSGQLYNYFCSPGIKYDEDFRSMPGFLTVGKLIAMLPRGISRGILHHSGERWNGTSVFGATGEFRIDGRIIPDTGDFAYVAYGPGDRVRIPIERNFSGVIINPETLETTGIAGLAGNYLPELSYTDGVVIVGSIT